jgi:antirestriction protein ArdC
MSNNLQKEVTERIIMQLRSGVVPWKQPWTGAASGAMPRNALTRRGYSGVNVLLLWSAALERGYASPQWLTFKQAVGAGGSVRKGETGARIVFVSAMVKEENGETRKIPFLKSYTVFNISQCDGLTIDADQARRRANLEGRDVLADDFMHATGAVINHGESRAYFRPSTDSIMLPNFETFTGAGAYYATAFHELGHWTGAERRLKRNYGKRFGDKAYSAEELTAELTSAFLCAEFGFESQGADAAYISQWIAFLSDHDGAILTAASHASKAVEYMRALAIAEPLAIAA